MCDRWGVAFDMELKRRLLGTHLDEAGRILAGWVGQDATAGPLLAGQLIDAYRAAIERHGVDAMPGAVMLVEALAGRVPLVVASNTRERDTRRVLDRSPLPPAFAAVVCAGDGIAPKPAPDLYLAACAAVGAPPSLSIAFEDSPVGVASAKAAGLLVYGVPSTPGVPLDADVPVTSLVDVDPSLLAG